MKKRRIKLRVFILMCSFAFAAIILAVFILLTREKKPAQPAEQIISLTDEAEPEVFTSDYWVNNKEIASAGGVPVTHNYVPWDSPRRPGEVREIRYITIHETDNRSSGADSEAHNSLLVNDVSNSTGWHYTVDDHSIYHNLPDNEIGWNAGDNRTKLGGNINGIGIEMCVNLTNDYEQTLRNTAALAANLLVTYDLQVDDVRLHRDFMDKICPHRLISEGRVEAFYQMIRDDYTELLKEKVRNTIKRG